MALSFAGAQRDYVELVTATAEMAGLNILTYLTAYLDACGRNRGRPLTGADLERFLPWTARPSDMNTWTQPPRPG